MKRFLGMKTDFLLPVIAVMLLIAGCETIPPAESDSEPRKPSQTPNHDELFGDSLYNDSF